MKRLFLTCIAILLLFSYCKDDRGINIFTKQQDIEFGMAMRDEIAANPDEYPLIQYGDAPEAYNHLRRIRDKILASGELDFDDLFAYEVYLMDDDETINAFACPGGYLYFYTGLIRYLDDEAQFAGVMAHEMAHADQRHSTEVLTAQYGYSTLVNIILGKDPGALQTLLAQLAGGLGQLTYSRKNEYEADEYSIRYLMATDYYPVGIIGFFDKIIPMSENNRPVWFLTHPYPEDRKAQALAFWQEEGSPGGETYESRYQDFINSLVW